MAALVGSPPPLSGHLQLAPSIPPFFLLETVLQTPLGNIPPMYQPMIGELIPHLPSATDLIGHTAYPHLLAVAIGSEMVR